MKRVRSPKADDRTMRRIALCSLLSFNLGGIPVVNAQDRGFAAPPLTCEDRVFLAASADGGARQVRFAMITVRSFLQASIRRGSISEAVIGALAATYDTELEALDLGMSGWRELGAACQVHPMARDVRWHLDELAARRAEVAAERAGLRALIGR